MLRLNLKRVFALRGMENPYRELVNLGMSRPTAWNLLSNKVDSIKSDRLEQICTLLSCTPNDLYEWTPSAKAKNVETHPLKALDRSGNTNRYNELIKSVPLDKLAEAEAMLAKLQTGE